MGKKLTGKTKLSIEEAPIYNKPIKPKKLGLLTKNTTRKVGYRFTLKAIDALDDLTKEANKHSNIKISATNILQLLILNATKKDIKELISSINT